jgi:6-pyruvoyltetrahydropterin/6-carboxytetrahydropterin synthase
MNTPDFHIRVAGDDLAFSAGHFITLENGDCERLHGHTYRVAAEVFGPLDACQCVVDFLAVRSAMKDILAELDHRVLLPAQHPAIRLSLQAAEVEAMFADRRWVFPKDDCLLLPVANTTTEALARYIGERLTAALGLHGDSINRVQIELSEGTGCAAICDLHRL